MMEQKLILIIFLISPFLACSGKNDVVFDIRKYGARPNVDIGQALTSAWKAAIVSRKACKIYIPGGKWRLTQVVLNGPSKAPVTFQLAGTIKADPDASKLPNKNADWITFQYMNKFTITGGGVFDGNGQASWKECATKKCNKLPLNLSLNFLNNSLVQDITTKDSKNFHAKCLGCHNVTFNRYTVTAPGDSPNTDGLHLSHSKFIRVTASTIQTGDDCVSMGSGVSQVNINGVTCGPGHGISIGSLGRGAHETDVTGIYVTNCTFIKTQNGVRVKTWPSGPATLVISDLRFEDLIMKEASSPVIIDQKYCPRNLCTVGGASRIQIRKVSIKNIRGTSATADVIKLDCSSSKPCQDVKIGNINLKYVGKGGAAKTKFKYVNVKPILSGKQDPPVCASQRHSHHLHPSDLHHSHEILYSESDVDSIY